jgi:predicted nuclease of predicted toxin-antitoxin system
VSAYRSATECLQEHGIEASHVADLGLSRAADSEIIEYARKNGLLIVTLDSDFHHLLAIGGANSPSVIRIRQEGLRGPDVAELIVQVLTQVGSQVQRSTMVTVTERSVRIHHLPLRKGSS